MHSLRLFFDVARHRSFSAAAAEHGITQSAASQRVGAMEKKLGVTLIDRSVRPLALTEAGEVYLRGVKDLLERYDRLEQQVCSLRPDPAGQILVDAIYSAGIDLLNHLKDSFEQAHPQCTVVIDYKPPDEVVEAVRQHRCDIGIVSYPKHWKEVGVVPLRDEPMAVVCSPRHALAGEGRIDAARLSRHSVIAFEPDLPVARAIKRYLREHGASPEVSSVFDNIDTIKSALAVQHEDLAILPKRTVMREVMLGQLAALDLHPPLYRPIGIILPRRQSNGGAPSSSVQLFIDHLLEKAGPNSDLVEQAARGFAAAAVKG